MFELADNDCIIWRKERTKCYPGEPIIMGMLECMRVLEMYDGECWRNTIRNLEGMRVSEEHGASVGGVL